MTRRREPRPATARVVAVRVVVLAVLAVLAVLSAVQTPALAAGSLQAVTVMPGQQTTKVVVQLSPAPVGAPATDAASVTALSADPTGAPRRVQARVAPVLDLDQGAPTAFVMDASAGARPSLPQSLSGAAGMMLQLPSTNPITVIADRDPPVPLTSGGATPTDGIQALTSISASGGLSTPAALALAVRSLQPPPSGRPDAVRLVVLTTSGQAPTSGDLAGIVQTMQDNRVVLGVVGTGNAGTSWSDVATRTGGLAVAANPTDASAGYNALLSALRARYVVAFPTQPSAAQAVVTVTSAGSNFSGPVDLGASAPGAGGRAQPSTGSTTSSASRPGTATGNSGLGSRLWGSVAILLVLAAVVAAVAAVRLRGRGPTEEPEREPAADAQDDDSALLPGVRVFDLSDVEAPTEIAPGGPEDVYTGRHRPPPGKDATGDDADEDDGDDEVESRNGAGVEDIPQADGRHETAQGAGAGGVSPKDGGRAPARAHGDNEENERPVKEAG